MDDNKRTGKMLENQIEALLYWSEDPLTPGDLSLLVDADIASVEQSIQNLKETLRDRGVRLAYAHGAYALVTAPEADEVIRKAQETEENTPLGKAGIETLTIILYRSPIAKSEIDHIRGVNSASILRALWQRGLIEKEAGPGRSTLYRPTLDALTFLGVAGIQDLPQYEEIQARFRDIAPTEHTGREVFEEDTDIPEEGTE